MPICSSDRRHYRGEQDVEGEIRKPRRKSNCSNVVLSILYDLWAIMVNGCKRRFLYAEIIVPSQKEEGIIFKKSRDKEAFLSPKFSCLLYCLIPLTSMATPFVSGHGCDQFLHLTESQREPKMASRTCTDGEHPTGRPVGDPPNENLPPPVCRCSRRAAFRLPTRSSY